MSLVTDANLLSILISLILIVCGSHVALLAWLGKNMYAKIGSIEDLVREGLAAVADKYQDLERRVVRIETRLESPTTPPRHNPHFTSHRDN
jgi:cell division protein FtsB